MVINSDNGAVIADKIKKADTFWHRLVGLIPYSNLPEGEGIILAPCQSVHTLFMRFTIDILYLDRDWRVLATFPGVKPWRLLPLNWRCRYVLEVPSGSIFNSRTEVGHRLFLPAK